MDKQQLIIDIIMFVFTLGIIAFSGLLVLNNLGESYPETYDKCCGGQPCTDTYWDVKQEKCIYTMQYPDYFYSFNWWTIPIVIGLVIILTLVITFITPYMSKEERIKK